MVMKLRKKLSILIASIFLLVLCGFKLPEEMNFQPKENIDFTLDTLHMLWPFVAFSGVLIAIALFFMLDPRPGEWAKITFQLEKHKRMYKNGLALEIEEEYRDG